MSENIQSLSTRWFFYCTFLICIGLLSTFQTGYTQPETDELHSSILQGSIHIHPTRPHATDQTGKIQPGTPVKVVVTVENSGKHANPPGQLYVRYAFAKPLDKEAKSTIFETEKKTLPMIEPGQKIEITFDTLHHSPSVADFVRDDWQTREYQAIAFIDKEEHVIGTLALTFSAYYYPGLRKEFPAQICKEKL